MQLPRPSGWGYERNTRNQDKVEDYICVAALLHLRPGDGDTW